MPTTSRKIRISLVTPPPPHQLAETQGSKRSKRHESAEKAPGRPYGPWQKWRSQTQNVHRHFCMQAFLGWPLSQWTVCQHCTPFAVVVVRGDFLIWRCMTDASCACGILKKIDFGECAKLHSAPLKQEYPFSTHLFIWNVETSWRKQKEEWCRLAVTLCKLWHRDCTGKELGLWERAGRAATADCRWLPTQDRASL